MISNQVKAFSTVEKPNQVPNRTNRRRRKLLTALLWFVLFLACVGGVFATTLADLVLNYGVSYGKNLPRIPQVSPAQLGPHTIGVNSFLQFDQPDSPDIDRTLDMIQAGGFGYIRQILPWNQVEPARGEFHWEKFDAIVEKASQRGIQVLFRLDQPPAWSRLQAMENMTVEQKQLGSGPPDNLEDYYNFVAQVAQRYKGRVKYYQVWNEPNLESEWNHRQVEPERYVELLKGAYQRIKAVDPQAQVLAAPLAPTNAGSPNMNDLVYLDRMYKAGAGNYFDILSVQVYGLGYSPDFRWLQPELSAEAIKKIDLTKPATYSDMDLKRINFNRPESVHEVMIRNGDGAKPAWVSEYGWVSVPSQWSADYKNTWGESVDEATQAKYLVQGIERIRKEWPWVGVINVWFFRPDQNLQENPANPTNYFSIVRSDYSPRPAYTELQKYNSANAEVLNTGWHPAQNNSALHLNSPQSQNSNLSFSFVGERVEVAFKPGVSLNKLQIMVDGKDSRQVSADGTRVTLAENLSDGPHQIQVSGLEPASMDGLYVSRDNHFAWLIVLGVAVCALGALVSGTRLVMLASNGLQWVVPVIIVNRYTVGPYFMVAALLIYYYAPPAPLAILGTLLFFPFCFVRPDWAIGLAAFSAPLYMHPRNLRPGGTLEFTVAEVIIVELGIAAALMGLGYLYRLWQAQKLAELIKSITPANLWLAIRRQGPFALPLAALLILATLSLLTPEPYHLKEALREYRLVIIEPLLLFVLALVFLRRKGSAGVLRLLDFIVAAGVMVSLVGLYQFIFPGKVSDAVAGTFANLPGSAVATEGVTRVVSVYAHPDNLGLFLGRVIPLTAALVLFSGNGSWQIWRSNRRRQFYSGALLIMLVTLVLSFSRGAWIGVALAMLVIFLAAGSRRGLLAIGGLLLLSLAALPFIKLERITSLFNLESGSSGTRLYLWQSAIEMIKDHPITGVGLDQFLYNYNPQYVNPQAWAERFTSHPHNMILDFWLRLGVLGPFLLAWLLVSFCITALSTYLRKPGKLGDEGATRRRALTLGLLGSMTDFIVHGMVDNSYFVIDLAVVFCLSCAMLEIVRREALTGQVRPGNRTLSKEKAA
ncbi:MAG TPA: O-antigen ligase family protein [Chloroflexia bacterium]|nr:O-antigen ligase family protein [Chloroflexia bacterium]